MRQATSSVRIIPALILMATLAQAQTSGGQAWTHYVRIAGHSLHGNDAARIVAESTRSNVFGIEVDNDIPGRYESFLDPTSKLVAIRKAAEAAHAAGNRSFVYIAGLECITANAANTPHSMFKDHPAWVQRKKDGKPAMFGGRTAFWIRKGDEDVWVSPFPPDWRERYMRLVRQIAETGIDGVYVDIPYWMTHFEGWEKTWASFDDYTVDAFRRETGLDARRDMRLGDVSDAHFRRWIDFRIRAITEFVKEIHVNVKAGNPQCITIPEIYPGIEETVPRVGADVYELYPLVDTIAHEYQGMGDSMAASKSPFEWFDQMIGMFAFRSFAGDKPSWMLNYSWDGEKGVSIPEAMQTLFAAQLTAGANSWDAKGHVMLESNDLATRTRVFAWIRAHEHVFYDVRQPVDPVGVYFSPQTRNYFPEESIRAFKGTMNLLLMSHREFQIVTPRTLSAFAGRLLILPDTRCLGDDEAATLHSQASRGVYLYATGLTGSLQADGSQRATNALEDLPTTSGATWEKNDPGMQFQKAMTDEVPEALLSNFENQVLGHGIGEQKVTVTAPSLTIAQIAQVNGKVHVFFDNFGGIQAKRNLRPETRSGVVVSFPAEAGSRVRVLPFLGTVSEVKTERKGDKLVARVPAFDRAIVVWCE
jgi:hypothetical protein